MEKKSACSRREFLAKMSSLPVLMFGGVHLLSGSQGARHIAQIDVFPITYPMRGRFKFFEGPDGHMMGRASAVIKVKADDGTVGWGESVPIPKWSYETLESVTTTIRNYLAPVLVGHEVFDIAGAHRIVDQNIAPAFGTGQPMAKAGIDIALHDLLGKMTHRSLPEIWGRKAIPSLLLSYTLNPESLDDLDALIEDGRNRGYRNFNVKVSPDPEYDLELCRRVKKRAPEGYLWADANGGYDLDTALKVVPEMAEIGVDILEQPLPITRITGYQMLKRESPLPILLDEGVVSPANLVEFIRLDLMDGVAMKPARCGGLLPAKRQIEITQDAGLLFLGSGLTDPDISLAATLQLYAAFQYQLPAALNGPQFIRESILRDPLIPEQGRLSVPEGPGLGITVEEAKIRPLLVEL
ncbi:MAG TPA: enolase C-terminal domain-like protein [bacterium]|nr:enolase C-terminal domain-like protein [bacterium]